MRPSALKQALKSLIQTRRPVFVWGPPGVGKSSIIRQAAHDLRLEVVDVRAVLLDPVDLRGLPHINSDGRAHWCPPSFLPSSGQGVIFLDELAQAPPLVQAACLQLTLDRRIGEYELPDGWTVIAASNRAEDRAGAHKVITPLLNRFIHLDLEVSVEDWQSWALTANVTPEVRSFINFRPSLLFSFDPQAGARAFPTPRSWEFVSQIVRAVPDEIQHAVVAGAVGDGPAAEFIAFVKFYRQLPDVGAVIANPDGITIPSEPAVLYALCGALAETAKTASDSALSAIARFALRMQAEFAVLLMRDVCAVAPRVLLMDVGKAFIRQHQNVLLG